MKIKPLLFKLHLWLGLGTGIIVFIVSITGSIYVFKDEIKDAMEPWRFVQASDAPYAPPSQLIDTAKAYIPGYEPTGLTFAGRDGAAAVGFWINEASGMEFKVVFMNPYTAQFIKKQEPLAKGNFNFFEFIINGHTRLWLPEKVGKPLVGIAVIIFIILLLTGIVMWWPKQWTLKNVKRNLSVKFSANKRRLNYDLHNALGMYVLVFVLVLALTGLTWSFKAFDKGLYFVLSGGKEKLDHHHPHSNLANKHLAFVDSIPAIDRAFYLALHEQTNPARVYMSPTLEDEDDAIEVVLYTYKGKFYHHNEYFYDRYTLEPLRIAGDRYNEATFADKLDAMYYDIHTGAILGLPGKILALLASLISASLPVTGFMVWLFKRKHKQNEQEQLAQKLGLY